jgi:mono/diheme cytochrome c family protein
MSNSPKRPSPLPVIAGAFAGLCVYLGVNYTVGHAIVPSVESVTNISHGLSAPNRDMPYIQKEAVAAVGAGGAYDTVCKACHQADGKGMPGLAPALAGSEWMTKDPETPIRIVLLGLTGEIEVAGTKFTGMMPPPAVTDAQIVEAINHARTSFGNNASKIDEALVKKVRESLAGRTKMWTAEELIALRPAEGAAPAEGTAPPAEGATPAAPAPAPAPTAPAPAPSAPN